MNVLAGDLNKFQAEVIKIPCLSSQIYFVVTTLCTDNLASNEGCGGFQKNFYFRKFSLSLFYYLLTKTHSIVLMTLHFIKEMK
jgi:hypothetical protein